MRVAILSDTHFPGRGTVLPDACVELIGRADLTIHAGDLADRPTLHMLQTLATRLVAVHGNADDDEVRRALPPTAVVDLPGLRLLVTHNGGAEAGRRERFRRKYPDVDGVIFGHSHVPLYERGDDGFFILNPGSATDRRRQPRHSMVELEIAPEGSPPTVRFWAVDDPIGPLPDELIRGC